MIDGLREIFETMTRHRLRALATAFGVFWGIFMLTLLLAGGRGLRNGIDQLFSREAVNAVWISTSRTTRAFEGLGAGRYVQLTVDDATALERGLRELGDVSPRARPPGSLTIANGTRTAGVPVMGVRPGYLQVDKVELRRGRLLNALDIERARKVVIVGQNAASLLFEHGDAVGKSLTIGGVEFAVIGVFSDPSGDFESLRMYIPHSTLMQVFDSSGRIDLLTATLRTATPPAVVRERVLRLFSQRLRFDPKDTAAMRMWFAEEEQNKVRQVLRGIDLAILVVGLGTLISGMVGVSNILFVAVRERAKEFALRRALGATARSILGMVMAEAVMLASLAGMLGLGCAFALVQLARRAQIRSEYFADPSVDLQTAFAALALLVASALVAGYFPAREAARMHPIEALRRE